MNGTGIGYPTLRGRKSADAIVIGGGLSGLHTALLLSKAGLNVIVLEGSRLFSGASGACAGMASRLGAFSYRRLEALHGAEAACKVAVTQRAALEQVRSLAPEGSWQSARAVLFAESDDQRHILDAEYRAAENAGLAVTAIDAPLPLPGAGGVALPDQGLMDMEKYYRRLIAEICKRNCRLYENSRVIEVGNGLCYTRTGSVRAAYIVVATGYPILTRPVLPMLTLESIAAARLTLNAHTAQDGVCLGLDGGAALSGAVLTLPLGRSGCRTDAEEAYRARYQAALGGAEAMEIKTSRYVRAADALPRAGAYSRRTPNLMLAAGYGRLGIVGSMAAAQAISARVLGLPIEGYDVYERSAPPRALFAIGGNALRQTERYVLGMTRVLAPRCPHMGCKLRYSRALRGWVCPCHGSRFDDLGQVTAAPAVDDAQIKHG